MDLFEIDTEGSEFSQNEDRLVIDTSFEASENGEVDQDDQNKGDDSTSEVVRHDDGDDDSSDEEESVKVGSRLKLFSEGAKNTAKASHKKNDFCDGYLNFDMDAFGESSATVTLQKERLNAVDELLATKSIAHQPGFNQLHCLPHSDLSKKKARQLRKIEREKTKGDQWFNMPATEVTEEVRRDLEVLQMRSVLDPKTFYKKNDLKVLPKYFQVGRIVDNAADFYHSRIPKKERKRTMVDELLADAEFQHKSKQKYKEIVAEKQQYNSRAHKHSKRLKRKK